MFVCSLYIRSFHALVAIKPSCRSFCSCVYVVWAIVFFARQCHSCISVSVHQCRSMISVVRASLSFVYPCRSCMHPYGSCICVVCASVSFVYPCRLCVRVGCAFVQFVYSCSFAAVSFVRCSCLAE